MTLVFELLDTVRFQIQEMARVEKIISDEAIHIELDIHNRLLPGEAQHAGALTRATVTPAVHYLRFAFTEAQVAAFRDAAEVALAATHPAYETRTVLPPRTR
jgi:hypothetical protein